MSTNDVKYLSGVVRKTPPNEVSSDRYEWLRLNDAEPDLGVPPADDSILASAASGERRWLTLSSGISVVNDAVIVDENTLPIDTSLLDYSNADNLAGVLADFDEKLTLAVAGELNAVVTDDSLIGTGTPEAPLSIIESDTLATVTGRGNSTSNDIQLNNGANLALAGASTAKIWINAVTPANITANTAISIDSWAVNIYRSAKYTIQLTQGSKYQQHEIRIIHDGTLVRSNEYAVLETDPESPIPVIFNASINTGTLSLIATVSNAATTAVSVIIERTLFSV
jgi:hypothetical protein